MDRLRRRRDWHESSSDGVKICKYNEQDEDDDSESTDSHLVADDDAEGDEEENSSWISWFCGLQGSEFLCQVDEDYIQDNFNLNGLSNEIPFYDDALSTILGQELPDAQTEAVAASAERLYGLIHVRYILTSKGMAAMLKKYMNNDFGACPRIYCEGQRCLPVGMTDTPGTSTVKLYCPRCEDVYRPRSRLHEGVDGAYFGTTFPHLLLLTNPMLKPREPSQKYAPRIYGFRIHRDATK